jgi:hypothetical protein
MIMDGAKEFVEGNFKRKLKEAGVHRRQIEPRTPHSNAAETLIKELKNGVTTKMYAAKCLNRLWDDCLDFQAYIQSNFSPTLGISAT